MPLSYFSGMNKFFLCGFILINLFGFSNTIHPALQKKLDYCDSLYLQLNSQKAIPFLKLLLQENKYSTFERATINYKLGYNFNDIQAYDSAELYFNHALLLLSPSDDLNLYANIAIKRSTLPKQSLKVDENLKTFYEITKDARYLSLRIATKLKISWYWLSVSWLLKDDDENKNNYASLVNMLDSVKANDLKDPIDRFAIFETYSSINSFLLTTTIRDTVKAEMYLKRAEKIMNKNYLRYTSFFASAQGLLSFCSYKLDESIVYYQLAADLSPKTLIEHSLNYHMIGKIYYQKGAIDSSIKYLRIAEACVLDIDEPNYYNHQLLKWLSNAYLETDSFAIALHYLKKYTEMGKAVNDKRQLNALNAYKYFREMETLEADKQKEAAKHKEEKKLFQLMLTIAVIGLFIFFFGFLFYRKFNAKLAKQKIELEDALKLNTVLVKEIHHRVKNNLQMVSALLNLQSKKLKNEDAIKALKEGQNRIESVAIIHQNLYQNIGESVDGKIIFKEYLENLTAHLCEIFKNEQKNISIEIDVPEGLLLDLNTSIPLGLIINEFLTNSFKHAFNSTKSGLIHVSLKQTEDEKYTLTYKDNGSGMSKLKNKNSFGLSLIDMLTIQLGGKLNLALEKGVSYTLIFKIS